MSQPHAVSGDVIDIRPLGAALHEHVTSAFFKSAQLELVRLVMPRGKVMREHQVAGEITVLCIEGVIEFNVHGLTSRLTPGDLVHLHAGEPHSLQALSDVTALLTICLARP
ncbi:MAG: cupin domain-containing protein [Ideonella sp. WA131b]|jgi:quercetin dioxygenase-like cupin family protein|nr:cupin domain-containing protein [Ideonella sp. WA131b]